MCTVVIRGDSSTTTDIMPSIGAFVLAATAAILAIFYQLYVSPMFEIAGKHRVIEPLNTEHCERVEGSLLYIRTESRFLHFLLRASGLRE